METFLVKILDDLVVDFYLELKKNEADKTKFPLCLNIAERLRSIKVKGNYSLTIQFTHPHREIYFPDQGPNENQVEILKALENYRPKMPTCDNAPMSFAAECVWEGLEEDFDDQVNNAANTGAQSWVRVILIEMILLLTQ